MNPVSTEDAADGVVELETVVSDDKDEVEVVPQLSQLLLALMRETLSCKMLMFKKDSGFPAIFYVRVKLSLENFHKIMR